MTQKCEHCAYSREQPANYAGLMDCRRNSPANGWPDVLPTDWCGEFVWDGRGTPAVEAMEDIVSHLAEVVGVLEEIDANLRAFPK